MEGNLYSSNSPPPEATTQQQNHPVSDSESDSDGSESSQPEIRSGSGTPEIPQSPEGETPPEVTAHQFTRYECGARFQAVDHDSTENESLCLEDVQKTSKELWLIKAPHNFDFESLSGQQVLLNAQQILTSKTAGSHGDKKYDVIASETSQPYQQVTATHVLLPSRNSKKLEPGPVFKGQITITESVAVPAVTLPPTPPTKIHELPPGLKQRYVPFGWGEPTVHLDSPPHSPTKLTDESDSSKKKKKKKRIERENKTSGTKETSVHDHRKAHKRKIKTEAPEDIPVTTKKKKKSKVNK